MVADPHNPEVGEKVERALDDLFQYVITCGGAITGEHGIGLAKKRWWSQSVPRESLELHQVVKRALDPGGILNPGKFL
jgi:glycolate oxidase